MKYIWKLLLVSIVFFGFTACQDKKENQAKTQSGEKKLTLAMISDIGNIDDRSFNQNTWEGILRYVKEANLPKENYSHTSSHKPEDYINNLSHFADKGIDLIVSPGYYFIGPVNKVAPKYPKQKFLLIDGVSSDTTNVLSVTFATNEGSYLAGVCTAFKAKEMGVDRVGFLGGIDGDIVQSFEAGFIEGIKVIDSNIKIEVRHADDFANPTKGQRIASQMYDDGIKIIFNVAGNTGNGLIREAKRRAKLGEDVWVVGVDQDQYEDGIWEEGKSVILTSVLKKLDIATYTTIKAVENGTFKAGQKVYSLKNDGVGLPKINPNLKEEWIKVANKYRQDIIDGKIKVSLKPARVLSK